jgi:hypothetical protein
MGKVFEIWSEGFRATGDIGTAHKHGEQEGEDFADACRKQFADDPPNDWGRSDFDPDRLTYWGCRLFDNEADARERFG